MTGTKPDQKNPKMKVGCFDGGIVFNIPVNITATKIRVTVTKEKDGKNIVTMGDWCNWF